MSQRRERIPAKDVKDSKNWSLPYWTQSGDVIQKEDDSHDHDPDIWVEDEEEMELEPLTAEALEKIRQEAYNDGLEQGLVEGRQKGEKKGYDEGYQEGNAKGLEEGKSQGYKDGLQKGEKEAQKTSDKQKKAFRQTSQHVFENIDNVFQNLQNEIQDSLPELVEILAQAVVGSELEQGSEHIVQLVKSSLEAIPVDKKDVTIIVNEADLPFLEAGLDSDYKIVTDDRVDPGGCKLQSKQSSSDYTLSTRLQQVLSDYKKQLQLGSQVLADESEKSMLDGVDLHEELDEQESEEDSGNEEWHNERDEHQQDESNHDKQESEQDADEETLNTEDDDESEKPTSDNNQEADDIDSTATDSSSPSDESSIEDDDHE